MRPLFSRYMMYVPAARVMYDHSPAAADVGGSEEVELTLPGDHLRSYFQIQTPDTRLIEYDCGKLQVTALYIS